MGARLDGGVERPRAVSEYLVERLALGGATKLCFVISPSKSDILRYYGARVEGMDVAYVVQPQAAGLCDAIFRAAPLIHPDETVAVGLPDTVWFPEDGLRRLPDDGLSFLLFPVERPELFDAVLMDADGRIQEIQVKSAEPRSNWIWGAFKMPGRVFHDLHALWRRRDGEDEYFGALVNAWIADGGTARGVPAGRGYVDVGTLNGYREALRLLSMSGARPEPGRLARALSEETR